MGILGGLIGGASRGVTANGGLGEAIAVREESNRRDDRNEREEKALKLKEKLIKTQMLATRIADPNQSDAAVIQATNELNEINGIPVRVTTIEEALPQRAEAKKIANLLGGAKGNFTPTLLKDAQLSLTQYESRFGENEALRNQLEAGRASLDKEQNKEIDFMARSIANSADGGKSSPQQIAEFTRLKGKMFAGGDKEISNRINQRAMEFRKQNKDLQFTQSRIDKNSPVDNNQGMDPSTLGNTPISGSTLWKNAGLSTGVMSGAKAVIGSVAALGGATPAIATGRARTQLDVVSLDLSTALSDNTRYPEGLRKAILKKASLEPSIWQTPARLRSNLIELDQIIKNKINEEVEFIQKGRGISNTARSDAVEVIKQLTNFRNIMGVPENADSKSGISKADEDLINKYLPKGTN